MLCLIVSYLIYYLISKYYLKIEKIFMNPENSKANEFKKFIYYFTDKINVKNPNKNIAFINLSIYYTWKNIKSAYSRNKLKISAPT